MKTPTKLSLALAVAAALFSTSAFAGPGPGNFPAGFPTQVKSKAEAMECCKPGQKLALACKDCKTAIEKTGEEKKTIASWFSPDDTHNCSGCGGKISLKTTGGGKGPTISSYTHTCTKCGANSAYTCATHKKS
jgi:hypothetical protein